MSSEKRSANALGGKTARPCDSCLCKRARWYCAADDAFLCQSCDASVHSANQLARRHERLCLKTSSATGDDASPIRRQPPPPPWLTGFRRKARTPRHHSKPKVSSNNAALVPLLVPDLSCSGDDSSPPDDEQLLYRVPVFDPLADPIQLPIAVSNGDESRRSVAADVVLGFDTCDADLAADMESLLANDLDSETFCMEALGLMDSPGVEWRVKVEEVDELVRHVEGDMDLSCDDTLDLKFGCESPATDLMGCCDEEEEERERKKICLSLDYEAVITAWASQGSPWMNGDRPNLNPDDCWPDWTGISSCGLEHQQQYDQVGGGIVAGHHQMMMMDRGREARVSRYREKRRSRLFSKKIRYEVRKLNAEKRPRMKGRFVKRASLVNGPHPHPPPPGVVVAAAANFSF